MAKFTKASNPSAKSMKGHAAAKPGVSAKPATPATPAKGAKVASAVKTMAKKC